MSSAFDVDALISRVLSCALSADSGKLVALVDQATLIELCGRVRRVLLEQPALLELEAPIIVCGDIHGHYTDLLRIFNRCGFPPSTAYLFLGDYVDRGAQSLECITLLFAYKLRWPEAVFLVRGNHEVAAINLVYGFYAECAQRYSVRLWQIFQDTFNCLPFCALIDGRIVGVHGGLSPLWRTWNQMRHVTRPLDPPLGSVYLDVLWSDPEFDMRGWRPSSRGVSYVFGEDIVAEFCHRMNIDLIVRAHQVVQDGYEFFANRRLVTIFSAGYYCGTYDNAAAVMSVSATLRCAFTVFHGDSRKIRIVKANT